MILRFRIPCFFLAIFLLPGFSVARDSQQVFRDIESLFVELRLNQADQQIDAIGDPGYRAFYQSNLEFYRTLSAMQKSDFAHFRAEWDTWLEQVEEISENDSLKEIMLADLSAKRGIVEFVQHNYLTAVIHVRSSRKYLDKSRDKYGMMVEQLKLEGLFEVLLSSMPEKYKWIADPLGLTGNVNTGLTYLRISARTCRLFNGESQLLLAMVEKNILDQPEKTIQRLERYRRRLQRPAILVEFFQASCLQRIKKNERSLRILEARTGFGPGISDFPFWDYLAGKGWYFEGNEVKARTSFLAFLDGYEGDLFKTDATFRIGMCWLYEGQVSQAQPYFREIAGQSNEQFDEDNYAASLAARFLNEQPGPVLLGLFRARSAYDGGYHEKAMTILTQTQSSFALRSPEWVEWYYRKGRIYQDQGRSSEAIDAYQKCLTYSADKYTTWLQAYACFYVGEIYAEQEEYQQASDSYRKALAYDDYFYQSGLENRCKSAQSELAADHSQASSNR